MDYVSMVVVFIFFFSSRRRHTRCALVTGVQTCALPIYTLQPHAGIYGRARQIDPGFLVHLLILHEDQVPDLYEPVAVLIRRTGRPAGDVLSVIEEYLGTGAARAGVAHRPEIIRCRYRSEEHTSELQSLMRISYALFCLKKKRNKKNT